MKKTLLAVLIGAIFSMAKAQTYDSQSLVDTNSTSTSTVTKEMNRIAAENTKAIAANNKEIDAKIKALDRDMNDKIKKALDNPLANK